MRLRYLVQWRKHGSYTDEYHSIEDLKALFPGKWRKDLKHYVAEARAKWDADDDSRVKIDGSHKCPPPPANPPSPPLSPWPIQPIYQEAGRLCAFNAIRNLGFDLPAACELHDLKSLIDHLFMSGVASFVRVSEPARRGKFLYHVNNHCFCRIDSLFLDTDPTHPAPVGTMQEIGFKSVDVCYHVSRIKRKRPSC